MTNFKKALRDSISRLQALPTWKLCAFVVLFILMTVITFGGSAVSLALLYAWGDSGVYSGRATQAVYTKKGVRRLFVVPANPQTTDQTNIRNTFGSFSALWRSLTDSQQAAWRNLKFTASNRLGKAITYAGKQAYVRLNTYLNIIGVAQIDDAPLIVGVVGPETSGATIDVSDAKIDPHLTNAGIGLGLIVRASLPLLPGRTQSRMKVVYATSNSSAVGVPAAAWSGYLTHWGYTPQAGDNIIVEFMYVDNTTGEPSPNGGRGVVNVTA